MNNDWLTIGSLG